MGLCLVQQTDPTATQLALKTIELIVVTGLSYATLLKRKNEERVLHQTLMFLLLPFHLVIQTLVNCSILLWTTYTQLKSLRLRHLRCAKTELHRVLRILIGILPAGQVYKLSEECSSLPDATLKVLKSTGVSDEEARSLSEAGFSLYDALKNRSLPSSGLSYGKTKLSMGDAFYLEENCFNVQHEQTIYINGKISFRIKDEFCSIVWQLIYLLQSVLTVAYAVYLIQQKGDGLILHLHYLQFAAAGICISTESLIHILFDLRLRPEDMDDNIRYYRNVSPFYLITDALLPRLWCGQVHSHSREDQSESNTQYVARFIAPVFMFSILATLGPIRMHSIFENSVGLPHASVHRESLTQSDLKHAPLEAAQQQRQRNLSCTQLYNFIPIFTSLPDLRLATVTLQLFDYSCPDPIANTSVGFSSIESACESDERAFETGYSARVVGETNSTRWNTSCAAILRVPRHDEISLQTLHSYLNSNKSFVEIVQAENMKPLEQKFHSAREKLAGSFLPGDIVLIVTRIILVLYSMASVRKRDFQNSSLWTGHRRSRDTVVIWRIMVPRNVVEDMCTYFGFFMHLFVLYYNDIARDSSVLSGLHVLSNSPVISMLGLTGRCSQSNDPAFAKYLWLIV